MAKFTDTPKWKTKPKSDRPVSASTLKPSCPICGARQKMPCKTPDGTIRRAHPERRAKARHAAKSRQRLKTLQQRRWAGVTVRYACPDCGGDHPREKCRARLAHLFDTQPPSSTSQSRPWTTSAAPSPSSAQPAKTTPPRSSSE